MRNIVSALLLSSVSGLALANNGQFVIAKHELGTSLATTQYSYVPVEIHADSSGKNYTTLSGAYASYVQEIDGKHGLHYRHWLSEVKAELTAAGYQINLECTEQCSTKPYRAKIDDNFRYEGLYKVGYTSANKNQFGYLTAVKGSADQQEAVIVFAKQGYKDELLLAYEQISSTPMPSAGVKVDNNFTIKPMDFSQLKPAEKDANGAVDHPMLTRFPGSYLVWSSRNDFEPYPLITGPYKKKIPTKTVEGKVTTLNYRIDKRVGPYAVHKNYMNALLDNDFQIIFECSAATCGNMLLRDNLKNTVFAKNHKSDIYNMGEKSHYYLFTAEKQTPQGKIYASMYSFQTSGKYEVEFVADIIEEKAVSQADLNIDSDSLTKEIAAKGSVSLYGIEFDFNKHTIKESSTPQLNEIADFLKKQDQITLYVVGHTDNKGAFDYNQGLAQKRAAEVVKVLTQNYQIKPSRLHPVGVGPVAPKAANDSDSNMQKNRRVELVLKSPLAI
ncbi:OmpA family protein [Motilimonas sp. E26]|uniref:OmpA family protein n=1 Tax=Motilimonas sp. E26 TaxID=2865674 RepID=UPI001E3CCC81|nr:OmpA family protein [Motilimonas sp. E26]MCE0555949.1 OmpA family protein [Motilimonas sp. E26]